MRHRITSFRCVEASARMRSKRRTFKSCNALYFRQSSTARAASGQAGTTSRGAPATSTANLPRLKAMASSKGSVAGRLAIQGSVRSPLLVRTTRGAPLMAPVRVRLTRRLATVQRSANCAPRTSVNTASLPPGTARQIQLPPATGTARQSATGATAGVAACSAAAITIVPIITAPACRPWPLVHRVRPAAPPLRRCPPCPRPAPAACRLTPW